jgi:hypothetical protein
MVEGMPKGRPPNVLRHLIGRLLGWQFRVLEIVADDGQLCADAWTVGTAPTLRLAL